MARPNLTIVDDSWSTKDDTGESTDDWSTVSPGGYARNRYYSRATDGHGHSEQMQFKHSPSVMGMIGAVVASGRTPYKTPQDLVRDAVIHRLHDLREMGMKGELVGQLPEVIHMAVMDQEKVQRSYREELCKRVADEVDVLMRRREGDAIVEHLDGLQHIAEDWPEFDRQQADAVVRRGNELLRQLGVAR